MNRMDQPPGDELRFDLLVDGELNDVERHQLLASLDQEPGAWRRCALAFLEAQAWQQSMRGMQRAESNGSLGADVGANDQSPAPTSVEAAHAIRLDRFGRPDGTGLNGRRRHGKGPDGAELDGELSMSTRAPSSSWLGLALAMAICFLVAFVLGGEFRQRWVAKPTPSSLITQRPIPRPAARSAATDVSDAPPSEGDIALVASEVIPWAEATFVMDDAGREVEVPVFDLDPYAQQVLLENSTAALDHLRQQLQRSGFDVQRRVSWSPVEMGGGQQMYVPVGDFEISLAANRAAQ